jgi:hypothetical protein
LRQWAEVGWEAAIDFVANAGEQSIASRSLRRATANVARHEIAFVKNWRP